jgi:hypothetical protein
MKNLILTAGALLLLASCETKKEPKNEFEEAEMLSEDLKSGNVDDPIAFNDGLVAHINMSEVHIVELDELDMNDASGEEIAAAADKVIADLEDRISSLKTVKPVGTSGGEFVTATINQLKSVKAIAKMYKDFASDLAIPDDEWTDEMADSWYDEYDFLYANYDETFDALEAAQETYSSYQNIQIVDDGVSIEELYEQSKEN